ncbi:MAG: ribonuclease P protein component 1 [Candidatus ainarchaeum sp.]|nr:ribonuclease P protein component 1 [Candidatus ainarchaeum sp.]
MLERKNYCISGENIFAHEFLGLNARVLQSSDKNKIGLEGKIVDETKNLLVFETKNGIRQLPKKECVFEFELGKEKAVVQGLHIIDRPEDRVKNFWRKKNAVQ